MTSSRWSFKCSQSGVFYLICCWHLQMQLIYFLFFIDIASEFYTVFNWIWIMCYYPLRPKCSHVVASQIPSFLYVLFTFIKYDLMWYDVRLHWSPSLRNCILTVLKFNKPYTPLYVSYCVYLYGWVSLSVCIYVCLWVRERVCDRLLCFVFVQNETVQRQHYHWETCFYK